MFSVIYTFEVKAEKTASFEKAWKDLTLMIYEHTGSLGSRLHKTDAHNYVAYAQWPDKETWVNAKHKIPASSKEISTTMREACIAMETKYELELVEDLLKNETSH